MTTYTKNKAAHKTLVGTTADIVNLGNEFTKAEVINRSTDPTASPLYLSTAVDSSGVLVTAVAAADDTDIVMPGEAVIISIPPEGVSIVGSGNPYSVVAVPS